MKYSNICQKLGFDPVTDGYDYNLPGHEDDTQQSPFSVLTSEEADFLFEYMLQHRAEMKTEPNKKAS